MTNKFKTLTKDFHCHTPPSPRKEISFFPVEDGRLPFPGATRALSIKTACHAGEFVRRHPILLSSVAGAASPCEAVSATFGKGVFPAHQLGRRRRTVRLPGQPALPLSLPLPFISEPKMEGGRKERESGSLDATEDHMGRRPGIILHVSVFVVSEMESWKGGAEAD